MFALTDNEIPSAGAAARLALFCAALVLCCPAPVWAAVSGRALEKNVTDAVNTEAAAQRKLDAWSAERDTLMEDARALKYELQWLELQQRKLERYIASNSAKIADLEEAQGRYAVVALELENSLLADLAGMEESIKQSPPFLAGERANRIRFLRESLDDPELTIGEKYRRFTEGLNAEVEYGKKLAVGTGIGKLDGAEMDLIVIRAGRVGYYCLTMDRARGGVWNSAQDSFVSLQGDDLKAIQNIETMSQTKQFYDFAILPALQGVRQ